MKEAGENARGAAGYLKPIFECLRCKRGGSWASARTHYLQRCPRCSRCNSRRCLMSWSTPRLARRVRLRASRARWSAPVGAWLLLGRDCSGRAGRLSVPGDGHGSDRPDPRWAGAPRWPGSAVAATAAARTAQAPERLASGSIPPAPGSPACGRGTVTAASSPVRSACSGRITPKTRPPDRDDPPIMTCPVAAAATCLRSRNARLPGIIC